MPLATVLPSLNVLPGRSVSADSAPRELPGADDIVAHTLVNCLLREISGPEHQVTVTDGHLLVRLPRRDALLRVRLRRTSLFGAHRFVAPVTELHAGAWEAVDWRRLAGYVSAELTLRTGVENDEFLDQIASSYEAVSAVLAVHRTVGGHQHAGPADYLTSEQSLLFGHRFHPTPKARSGTLQSWTRYAPETGGTFGLRLLAVRSHLIAEEATDTTAFAALDRLHPKLPAGYRVLPVHPWQYELLSDQPGLRHALDRGDILDMGIGETLFAATASVRTLYDGNTFLKFSLNIRITNCLRKNASYELYGAVAMTRILGPVFDELRQRFPNSTILLEPAYRSLALPGPDGTADRPLLEGFGVIVREGLSARVRPGVTALLAAAVADEYPTSPAQVSRLVPNTDAETVLRWWKAYLDLLVPPVLAAYFDYGVVLEPHLQNVLIGVDPAGLPVQVLFRDLEGTKLLPEQHAGALASLLPEVAVAMSYDAERGWDRVVYCLIVNNIAEMLGALADLRPSLETTLWTALYDVLDRYAAEYGCPPRLSALLSGVPLPAKANLLTRWERKPDRDAGYVRLASPFALIGRVAVIAGADAAGDGR
jgi:siderophore synthetase component